MKKNNKGFTLIELLAVIIILAIIALIAVPTVMNIINDAKKGAAEDSTYGVISAAETYYAELMMNGNGTAKAVHIDFSTDGTYKVYEGTTETTTEVTDPKFELKGTAPTAGSVQIAANGTITLSGLKFDTLSCAFKSGSTSEVECNVPTA